MAFAGRQSGLSVQRSGDSPECLRAGPNKPESSRNSQMIRSHHALTPILLLLATAPGLTASLAWADGDPAPTYQRERQMQRYKGCHWTDDMGKNVYECIKKNDGFGTHWCYDETLEKFCPAQLEAAKKAAAESAPADKPAN
jgi:hypothetical protein